MHNRLIGEVRSTLAAQTDRDPSTNPVVRDALRSLVRLETIPRLERELAAEYAKVEPDPRRLTALISDIQGLHRGDLPDSVRDALLQS